MLLLTLIHAALAEPAELEEDTESKEPSEASEEAAASEESEVSEVVDSTPETSVEVESDDPFPRHYDGFGGVSLGVQRYFQFSSSPTAHNLLDGRETLDNASIGGTVVTSYYFSRISKSRLYVGYAVSAMFSDKLYSSKEPNVLMNPYCPTYDWQSESVNGGDPGGDYNTFRPTEGTYLYQGEEYEYSCMDHFGVRSNRETLVHIPAEFNMAWVGRPLEKVQYWFSGGISINWYDYKYSFSQNGFSTVYDSYYGDSVEEATYDMYWSYDYEERYGASKAASDSGWKGFKESYLFGVQVSSGVEYIFGELPRIGGEWGIGSIAKYSYVRGGEQTLRPKASMDYELVGGAEGKNAYKESSEMSIKPNLSNFNLSASLVWHY